MILKDLSIEAESLMKENEIGDTNSNLDVFRITYPTKNHQTEFEDECEILSSQEPIAEIELVKSIPVLSKYGLNSKELTNHKGSESNRTLVFSEIDNPNASK